MTRTHGPRRTVRSRRPAGSARAALGLRPPMLVADTGYGPNADFRRAPEERGEHLLAVGRDRAATVT
ncbi:MULTISPECIES: hypothetical protein [unclassified Streptomyces]|uniref:hypothetical protein n=1 Tax=unclassified Streptomyces TaxID=2593676 RepID=UPI002E821D7F|nr:hypothetical protein [Streptomyces sp. NBC_00589]